MKNLLLGLMCVYLVTACGTTYKVYKATGTEKSHGIYYNLPKNQIRVAFPVTSIKTVTGRYAKYARECFDENDIPANAFNIPPKNGRSYTLAPTKQEFKVGVPTFELLSTPDPTNRYFVDLKTPFNPFKSAGGSFELSQMQILNGVAAKSMDTTYDFAIGLATAAAKGFKAGGGATAAPASNCDEDANKAIKALEAVRVDLLNMHGEIRTPVSEKLYNDMRSHLMNREAQLLGYFFGEKSIDKKNRIIVIEPMANWTKNVYFNLFSEGNGKFDATNALEEQAPQVYLVDVTQNDPSCSLDNVCLTIEPSKPVGGNFTEGQGFAYRIPGEATFKISQLKTVKGVKQSSSKGEKTLPVAQLGEVSSLPNRFGFINSEIAELKLDPLTGGIAKLSVNGSGLSTEQAGALNSYIQAEKGPAADTTVADLTKQRDILLLQQQLATLEAGGTID